MGAEVYTVPARFLTTMAHLIATLTVLYDVVRAHATVNMASVQSRSHPLALSTGPSGAQAALGERDSHTRSDSSDWLVGSRHQRGLGISRKGPASQGALRMTDDVCPPSASQENVAVHAIDEGDSLSSAKSSCVPPPLRV